MSVEFIKSMKTREVLVPRQTDCRIILTDYVDFRLRMSIFRQILNNQKHSICVTINILHCMFFEREASSSSYYRAEFHQANATNYLGHFVYFFVLFSV